MIVIMVVVVVVIDWEEQRLKRPLSSRPHPPHIHRYIGDKYHLSIKTYSACVWARTLSSIV